jgi:hypothetical protein
MTYEVLIETEPGKTERYYFDPNVTKPIARAILIDKMQQYRENHRPTITMTLLRNDKVIDTLYRNGQWHSKN